MTHREIPIKVTAWVDEGVASLVSALNEYDQLVTLDSCECDERKSAYVLFRCQGPGSANFASDLGRALEDSSADYVLRAEWTPGSDGEPLLELTCPPDRVTALTEAVSACRKTLSPCGTACIAPGSSTGRRDHQQTVR